MHPSMLHAASSLINYEEIELSFMWISHCDAGGLLGHSAQWLGCSALSKPLMQ